MHEDSATNLLQCLIVVQLDCVMPSCALMDWQAEKHCKVLNHPLHNLTPVVLSIEAHAKLYRRPGLGCNVAAEFAIECVPASDQTRRAQARWRPLSLAERREICH